MPADSHLKVDKVSVTSQATQSATQPLENAEQPDSQQADSDANQFAQSIEELRQQLGDMSKKVAAISCCQQPFDQALNHYLSDRLETDKLIKRP